MGKWIEIGPVADFPHGTKNCITADGVPVVVCHIDGELTAFHNACPHARLPLGDGDLTGKVLTCPFHGYAFNVHTGCNVDFADDVPLDMLEVRHNDGRIEIQLKSND